MTDFSSGRYYVDVWHTRTTFIFPNHYLDKLSKAVVHSHRMHRKICREPISSPPEVQSRSSMETCQVAGWITAAFRRSVFGKIYGNAKKHKTQSFHSLGFPRYYTFSTVFFNRIARDRR